MCCQGIVLTFRSSSSSHGIPRVSQLLRPIGTVAVKDVDGTGGQGLLGRPAVLSHGRGDLPAELAVAGFAEASVRGQL